MTFIFYTMQLKRFENEIQEMRAHESGKGLQPGCPTYLYVPVLVVVPQNFKSVEILAFVIKLRLSPINIMIEKQNF
jgi:hypothetical protein